MLLRLIYDDKLAQAAWLFGCQRTREAIIFDPERDVDRYIDLARAEGLRIVAAAETHIHADFLSGVRELAERTGATAYVSGEGGPDWSPRWLNAKQSGGSGGTRGGASGGAGTYAHRLLKHNDTFDVGGISFRVVHTPGHTPEHICYLVTDKGAGATEPMGIVSGDFVFVGDLGRPDLLESAAGQAGMMEPSARKLFASVERFRELPDFLQVWPGHGAGSACGKSLGAVPQTTVGYEKRFNPAIRAAATENDFVRSILEGQPEPPAYFARMKKQNVEGVPLLGELPAPPRLTPHNIPAGAVPLDTRPWDDFREGHLPGAISAPLDKSFNTIAASYIDPDDPIILIIDPARTDEAVRDLVRLGLDRIEGVLAPEDLAGARFVQTKEISVEQLKDRLAAGDAVMLDVRRATEFAEGHIPGAVNINHVRLALHLDRVPDDKPIYVNCRSGVRSARATALLERAGRDVTNIAGGFLAWERAGGKVVR